MALRVAPAVEGTILVVPAGPFNDPRHNLGTVGCGRPSWGSEPETLVVKSARDVVPREGPTSFDRGDAGFGTMVGRSEGTEIFDGGRVLFAECNVVDLV